MQRPGVNDTDEKPDSGPRAQHMDRQPVVNQAAIAREPIEAVAERGAGPEGVLEQAQSATPTKVTKQC